MSSLPDFGDIRGLSVFLRDAAEGIRPSLPPDGDWMPVAFVVDHRCEMHIIATEGWTNDEERALYVHLLVEQITRHRAVAIGMVATIWQMVVDPRLTSEKALRTEPRPRDNPMREEALLVSCLTADESLSATANITRHPDESPTLAAWQEWAGDAEGATATPLQEALRKVKSA